MWRFASLAALITILAAVSLPAQETEYYGPPPMLWAVPHIQLYDSDAGTRILRGLDASVAFPITPRASVTGTWYFDRAEEDYGSALFNYDHPLREDTILRGSVGIMRDDFGYGVTLHRSYKQFGVGAYANNVDGDFEGGLMLTKQVPWGIKLGKVPVPRRQESTEWSSGAGDVGDLGARAMLSWRAGRRGDLSTSTAYFPQRRQSWPREGHSVQSASYSSIEFAPPAKPAWRYQTEGPIRTSAAIVDGVAYVGSYDGWLYALDVALGRRLWRFPAESAITGAPAVDNDQIFFGTEAGDVFCVTKPRKNGPPTGQLQWRFKTSSAVTASPLATETGLVIVGSCDSYLYAFDRHTGTLVWKLATGGPILASASKIVRRIPSGVDAGGRPTSRSASVLVGSSDGKLYAIEEVSGQVIWTFSGDGPITAAPVLFADRLYVTNRSGSLYALQPATGKQLWALKVPGSISHSCAVDDKCVYVGTTEGGVFAIENATGKMVWQCDLRTALAASPTLVSGQLMYLASRDGRLWTMDRPTGRVVNFHRESEPLTTCAAIADGHLLVGGDNGSLYAYVPGTGGLPLPAMEAGDIPTPVKPLEPDRPLPTAKPTVPANPAGPTITGPTQPETLPPTVAAKPAVPPAPASPTKPTTPQPVSKPVEAKPQPLTPVAPEPVAVKPTTPAVTPPSELTQPTAPSQPTPSTATRTDAPPTDFPPAVTPLSGPVTPPTTPTVKPTIPELKPPVKPETKPEVKPEAPTTGKSAGPDNKLPLLTLLMSPADGRTPILLTNQSYLFVGGKIAPGSDIVSIRVNGLEAPIKNGEYQLQMTFPGPGEYLLAVEAISGSGERSTYRRAITVAAGVDAAAPGKLAFRQRNGSAIVLFSAGTRGLQLAKFKKTIEIRNDQGQLVNNWVMSADENADLSWNGTNANGTTLPAGDYEVTYILSGESGPIAWLRQPLELQE